MSPAIRTDMAAPGESAEEALTRSAPEKSAGALRTIKEAADELDVPQHVLRFWETRFSQIRPMKRAGGRRYYRPDDVALLKGIKRLLHGQGYTIKGAQRVLRERGLRFVQSVGRGEIEAAAPSSQDAEDLLAESLAPKGLPDTEPHGDDAGTPPGLSTEARLALEDALADLRACAAALARLRVPPEPHPAP